MDQGIVHLLGLQGPGLEKLDGLCPGGTFIHMPIMKGAAFKNVVSIVSQCTSMDCECNTKWYKIINPSHLDYMFKCASFSRLGNIPKKACSNINANLYNVQPTNC